MVIRRLAVLMTLVLGGCAGQPGPPSAVPALASPQLTSVVTSGPSASLPAATASKSSAVPPQSVANGKIVFARHDPQTDDTLCFTIDPDGTTEAKLHAGGCGASSPDGSKVLTTVFKPNGSGPLVGGRPATTNPDGSGFKLLDAYPGNKLNLICGSWSVDGSRFLCESGGDATAADDGLYTVRSSDGGDLVRVTTAPAKHEDTPYGYSPDGSRILFGRLSDDEPSGIFVVNADGMGLVRLSPGDLSASEFSFAADWSPDGSQVVFGAVVLKVGFTALFVVNADGTGLHQIVSTDIGGATAQWSPDGRWIAFTSRLRAQPQVWLVHPDGTGQVRLTDGTDGSNWLAPIWSPDGSRLLFQGGKDNHVALWTMNPDGTGRSQLADVGTDLSSYSWGVASLR